MKIANQTREQRQTKLNFELERLKLLEAYSPIYNHVLLMAKLKVLLKKQFIEMKKTSYIFVARIVSIYIAS